VTGQWQDSRDVLGPVGEYQRATPSAIHRSAVVGTATLAVAEALARLGRELAIRVVADGRSADLAGVPPEVLMLPAATAVRRLPGLTTPAIGPAQAGGLTLTVGPGRPWSGTAAVSVACVVGDKIRVRVECAPDDPWGRSTTAAAEIVAEVLAELLADPTRSPADAAGLGAASRRRVLTDLAGPVAPPGRFRPLASLVEAQVDRDPERPAVVHAGATLTYGRLDRLANGLARELGELGVTRGDVVPLLLDNSLELPVSMLALLKLGAAFVPLDGKWPDRRLATALDVLDPPLTITAPGTPVPRGKELPVRIASLVETGERPGVAVGPGDLAYGVFTSGTTGTPRCALNHHGGLVNRLRFMTRWFGPAPDGVEVVLQNSKHTFDSAVWQLFWPLTTGGRTVVPAPGDFLDLQHTVETIATHGVTVTDFVPTTFNLLVARLAGDPDAVRRLGALRHLVVGGEEISPLQVHRLRRLLPGLRVSNAYGPSETAIGMVFHDVLATDGDDVPLGRPIDNCAAVVVDERLRPLPAGAVGEILIGGACVGAGYLGAPESTAAKFVPNPFPQVPGQLLYRSGDLGWYDERGRLHFGGRRDFQAKVNGVRIELGEVELAAEGCPGVRQATVLVAGTDAGQGLAVFAATDGTVTEPDLRDHLRRLLPRTSLPRHVLVLPELPLADSAKVDRSALVDILELRLARAATSEAGGDGLSPAERVLGAFRVALAEPRLPADADFLRAGGDSLRAVSLVAALRTSLGVDVGVQDLLEHPTAAAMAGFVARQRAVPGVPADERAALDADALGPLPGPLAPATPGPVRTVLLTGATGFVGAQLAYELLARTDARVVCLTRAAGDARARHRVVRALCERGLWRPGWGNRLVGVAGALDRPRLGLTAARWEELAGEADAVLHAGALVNFLYDYRTHRGANVIGTAELLRLAQHGRPVPLHHVSTLGVLDREAALHEAPLAEDVDPERVRPPETGYSRSKWVAERLLARAREGGATVTVLRLGEVMPSAAGSANPRALTHLLLTAFAQLRACPDVALRSDYTPVDWAARVAVAALSDPTAAGRDLHVLHPDSVCLTSVLPRAGVPLERLDPDGFRRRVADAAAGSRGELATLDGMLRRLPGGLDRLVVDNPALFRADAGIQLAARAGISPPDIGRAIRGYAGRLTAGAEEDACASG